MDNVGVKALAVLKKIAKQFLEYVENEIQFAIKNGELYEVVKDEKAKK